MLQNGVIETATGDLLRAGCCDFENDGSFDPATESYRTDVPHPAKCRYALGETQMHRWGGASWSLVAQPAAIVVHDDVISFTFQNSGAVLSTGVQNSAMVEVPYDCTIQACRVFGAPSGSVVIDLWKDTFANYPPTDADSITAAAVPTISDDVKAEDTTLTGWTTVLSAGDILLPNIDSVSAITWAKLVLLVKRGNDAA